MIASSCWQMSDDLLRSHRPFFSTEGNGCPPRQNNTADFEPKVRRSSPEAREVVLAQSRRHDPASPFLVGHYMEGDSIHDVPQRSWIDGQTRLFPE